MLFSVPMTGWALSGCLVMTRSEINDYHGINGNTEKKSPETAVQMLVDYGEIRGQYREVDCLDGMVLVTRYDIPWREDIFINWHFYDRSICLEYKRRGYFCVVPRQEMPWCVHACGVGGLAGWSDSLRVYLDEYRDFFQADKVLENLSLPDGEALQRADLAADKLEELIDRTEQVAFHSGIMDMHRIPDETYDVIICSHVPEHVRDDRKVLGEWKRVLKPEGKAIFFVPADFNATCIDEERKPFAQADYCRSCDKNGLVLFVVAE